MTLVDAYRFISNIPKPVYALLFIGAALFALWAYNCKLFNKR